VRHIKHIVVHCTATHHRATIANIQAGWRAKGWRSPGYHYIIRYDGGITQLLAESQIANGVKGHNAHSIHVSYIGGVRFSKKKDGELMDVFAADTRSVEQKRTLRITLADIKRRYPKAEIVGHRDLSPDMDGDGIIEPFEWVKECPSFDARREYATL
jgi:N-acetyl-anhydromuramyl-L-alanine amidase AmpD